MERDWVGGIVFLYWYAGSCGYDHGGSSSRFRAGFFPVLLSITTITQCKISHTLEHHRNALAFSVIAILCSDCIGFERFKCQGI